MGNYKEIKGDLITLARRGEFDVIAHGCNCFCTMGAGIAPQMVKAFGVNNYPLEGVSFRGDVNKLGNIDYDYNHMFDLIVVNAYTQYNYGRNHLDGVKNPIDYEALALCMRKINHIFESRRVGLPKIGAGLAGGNWEVISSIIKKELKDCYVTVVIFEDTK